MKATFITLLAFSLCLPALAQDKQKPEANPKPSFKTIVRDSLKRGERLLLTLQKPDGSWGDVEGRRPRYPYTMTALSVMALASGRHEPTDQSKEGQAMSKGLDFILRENPRRSRAGGYFGVEGSRMYGHGITTLCLAKMLILGVSKRQEARIREVTSKAVSLILTSQKEPKFDRRRVGGWRYAPTSRDADLTITAWQIRALLAAKQAGLDVPRASIDLAVKYVRRSYVSRRDAKGEATNLKSGFGYTLGSRPRYTTTSAGLLSLQLCNHADIPEAIGAANWLKGHKVNQEEGWFFYGTHDYSQCLQLMANDKPNPRIKELMSLMTGLQKEDGSWSGINRQERSLGKVYCTSLALISLHSLTGRNPLNLKMLRKIEIDPKKKTTP